MSYAGVKQSYEGPQVSYYRRIVGLWLTKEIHDIVGPAALTDDPQWGAMDGFAESHQRSAIVAMHPGGTTDIQRVIMARRWASGTDRRRKRPALTDGGTERLEERHQTWIFRYRNLSRGSRSRWPGSLSARRAARLS